MSEDSGDQDKQYEPSQKKLDDARKKGEVAKSVDLTTAAGYGGFLVAALAAGPASLSALGQALSGLLGRADAIGGDVFSGGGAPFLGQLMTETAAPLAVWAIAPGAVALLAVLAQRGLVFAPSKLAPKANRISLIEGFKRKFGREGLFEFAKSTFKLMIYSVVLGTFLAIRFPQIMATQQLTPALITAGLLRMTIELMLIVLVVSLVIGGVDFVFQAAEHQRKNRMSRKEVMDEQKQSEGDPMMKQQRRQKAVTIAMNRMLADVPEADVVIVNPTHYAVALKWDRMAGKAPVCVAKGVDEIAGRIRGLAEENGVPIHSDPPTARTLFASIEIGEEIRPDHYKAVAAAIRFADRMRSKARYT